MGRYQGTIIVPGSLVKWMLSRLAFGMALIAIITASFSSYAKDASIVLVVNESVSLKQIRLDELRAIYSLRQLSWSEDVPVVAFVLDIDGDIHRQFCRDFLKVYPHQLKKGWDRMEYTGRAQGPQVVQDEKMLLTLVQQMPGAIGYLSRDASKQLDMAGVHVISIQED